MKKIAILLSGEMRTYDKCYKSLFDFVDIINNKVDIFISTWNQIGGRIHESNNNFNKDYIDKNHIVHIYNPIIFDIVDKKLWEKNINILKIQNNHIKNSDFLPQMYMWLRVFLLYKKYIINNNVKYDIILRTRPDQFFFYKKNNFNDINLSVLNFYYIGGDKYSSFNFGEKREKTTFLNHLIMHKYIYKNINYIKHIDNFLHKLCLFDLKKYINFNILSPYNIKNIDNTIGTCDWLHISNYNNIEIICHSFLIYLILLYTNKSYMLKYFNNERCLPSDYIFWINNCKHSIMPEQFKHINYSKI